MKRAVGLGALVVVGGLALVSAQPKPEEPKVVTVEKVKDNLFVLRGGGGNTAVLVMANGVAVVDAKNPGWGQPILAKIKELTPKPVTLLINTHTHGDHVSGNVAFPASVDVVVQDNTRTNMEKMPIFKEHNNAGMAKRTFKDKMTIGRAPTRSTSTTSAAAIPTAMRGSSSRPIASCTQATSSRGRTCRSSTPATAAAWCRLPRR